MVKRETKRKIRGIFSKLLIIFFGALLIFILFFVGKTLLPFLSASGSEKIVRPVGKQTTLSDLKNKLSDRNIKMESLEEASESGTFIGRIRDGAEVYFSQNQDVLWQVNSLYLIIARTTIDNKKPKVIDMRSVRPIVKF